MGINAVDSCPQTSPGLFYPTKYYIYAQSVFGAFASFVVCVGPHAALLFLVALKGEKTGCLQAVAKMRRVPVGSDELREAEDGEIMDCPICTEPFEGALEIVATPCK